VRGETHTNVVVDRNDFELIAVTYFDTLCGSGLVERSLV
jgi:hypothetical protein